MPQSNKKPLPAPKTCFCTTSYSFWILRFFSISSLYPLYISVPVWTFILSGLQLTFTQASSISFHCYFSNKKIASIFPHPSKLPPLNKCSSSTPVSTLRLADCCWKRPRCSYTLVYLGIVGLQPSAGSAELFIRPVVCPWSATSPIFFGNYS